MAHPKIPLPAVLERAREIPDAHLNARSIRLAANGGAHDRMAQVQLARAIEMGDASAERRKELDPELADAVQLPDLGEEALASLVGANPNVPAPHTIAVKVCHLVTLLQREEQEAGERMRRRLEEDYERRLAHLQDDRDERDASAAASESRVNELTAEAERAAVTLAALRLENEALARRVHSCESERQTLQRELSLRQAMLDDLKSREYARLASLEEDMKQLKARLPVSEESTREAA